MSKPNCETHFQVGMPVERGFRKSTSERSSMAKYPHEDTSHCQNIGDSHSSNATISFMPQDHGREQTIAWLNTGAYESLASLLTERDQAASQIRRGPRAKGTNEVQQILKNPSCKTVEELHCLKKQTEMATRYGKPGVVVYNFRRLFGWNKTTSSKLPSLQLKDFETRMKEVESATASMRPILFSPINWLKLPKPTAAYQSMPGGGLADYEDEDTVQQARSLSPISEAGGWRDGNQVDIADSRLDPLYEMPMSKREGNCVAEEETDEDYRGEYGYHDSDSASMAL
ncbi:hypothetical protein F5Y01DRAFT_321248 [Xylaria sp. FL0043]|nr:hypothetical protein F5Y01DRAFT_321248 [Xylaria sp. FL0043]